MDDSIDRNDPNFILGYAYALDGLISAVEAAEVLGVDKSRARLLIANAHKKRGIGLKVGGLWLIHRDDIEKIRPRPRAGRPRGDS